MAATPAIAATMPIPSPGAVAGWCALSGWWRSGHIFGALEALHSELGDVFELPLPGFRSVMLVGPEANRFVLTEARDAFLWRAEGDPVVRLLRQGMLVTDGAPHDHARVVMTPALHRTLFDGFAEAMVQRTDQLTDGWRDGSRLDLLPAMRRLALLTLMETLYHEDIGPSLDTLWPSILRTIRYISPGPWIVWPAIPRPGYSGVLQTIDRYFTQLIARRRASPGDADDLVGRLITSGMGDDVIRDHLLTMFIAGHDTGTALLTWSLYLLMTHPECLDRLRSELDAVVGDEAPAVDHLRQLPYLDRVVKETLRLYPPIHLGSRIAATTIRYGDFTILGGTRVLYSIYLTHRDPRYWPDPEAFVPDRFLPEHASGRTPYAYVPFGGGPRNCIGAAFAQMEAKILLVRLLQRFDLRYVGGRVRPKMRATLEPHPHVLAEVYRR